MSRWEGNEPSQDITASADGYLQWQIDLILFTVLLCHGNISMYTTEDGFFMVYWKHSKAPLCPPHLHLLTLNLGDCHSHWARIAISQRSFHIWIISCGDTIKLLPYPSSHIAIEQGKNEKQQKNKRKAKVSRGIFGDEANMHCNGNNIVLLNTVRCTRPTLVEHKEKTFQKNYRVNQIEAKRSWEREKKMQKLSFHFLHFSFSGGLFTTSTVVICFFALNLSLFPMFSSSFGLCYQGAAAVVVVVGALISIIYKYTGWQNPLYCLWFGSLLVENEILCPAVFPWRFLFSLWLFGVGVCFYCRAVSNFIPFDVCCHLETRYSFYFFRNAPCFIQKWLHVQ